MFCKKCGARISESAKLCGSCRQKTGHELKTEKFPICDMYGEEVTELLPDETKNHIRYNYLNTMQNSDNILKNTKENNKNVLIMMGLILLAFFIVLFSLKNIPPMYNNDDISNITPTLLLILLFVYIIVTIFIVKKVKDKNQPYQNKMLEGFSHYDKEMYYFSQSVFGFVKLDRTSDNHSYFAYYEVDKSNIKNIGYDTKFAEYILYLDKPTYSDYRNDPKYEFRIQDIFSEEALSIALGCDLPPRHIPF